MGKNIKISVIIILTAFLSCNTTEPPPTDDRKLTLTFEDASCIEAWINITAENIQLPATINVFINDSLSQVSILNTQDSLIYIDSLLPNKTYKLKAASIEYGVMSSEISFTSMDTTSHNFTFETWTFGDVGSSVLYDVAIIDENNIWAVGEIMLADTNENGFTLYNTVHWNGNEWELKRIMFNTICGQQSSQNAYPASSIIAFSENEIWVAQKGDQIAKIENGIQTQTICMPWTFSINKIWGTSSNDLYVVGNNGNIAHYNGSQWNRLESGTELNINDIWGDYNEKTGEWEILAVASNKFFNEGNALLMIEGSFSTHLNTTGLPWSISSIWQIANKKYLIGGDGLFSNKILNEDWDKDTTFFPIYKDKIRGNNVNDIVISGSNGLLSHYNGNNWKHYINNELPFYSGRLLSVDIKNDVIIAVGWKETESIITIGIR